MHSVSRLFRLLDVFKTFFTDRRADARGIPPAEVARLMEDRENPPFLLDARTVDEWQEAHIAEAVHMPINDLGKQVEQIPKDREIICICRTGTNSGQLAQGLTLMGYRARNMSGGMLDWIRDGYTVERG